jgi:predicted transcriptional regulator
MTHLADKKLLERKRIGRQYVYRVRLSEADVVSKLTHGFLDALRKQYGVAGLLQFVDTVEEDLDPAVLARAKKILAQK